MGHATDQRPAEPTPTHERSGQDLPQRLPVPAPRPHPTDTLPRRTPGGSL
jgi:hypothetical protein